jgi:hypothetical protein
MATYSLTFQSLDQLDDNGNLATGEVTVDAPSAEEALLLVPAGTRPVSAVDISTDSDGDGIPDGLEENGGI